MLSKFNLKRSNKWKQNAHKNPPTRLRLKQVKAITGAVAAKVKANLFAMDRTKAQLLRRWNTRPLKTKQFIFAAANKLQTNPCAMVRTTSYKLT